MVKRLNVFVTLLIGVAATVFVRLQLWTSDVPGEDGGPVDGEEN